MKARRQRLPFVMALALVIASCSGSSDSAEPTTTITQPDGGTVPADIDPVDGNTPRFDSVSSTTGDSRLGFRLSEGSAVAQVVERLAVIDGRPLDVDEIADVVSRLPEWELPTDDVTDFNRPVESLRPPVVGDTIDTPFPPEADAPVVDAAPDGPLEVLRFQPSGDVDVAPFLSVTFNEPMVPLGTVEQLEAVEVPVAIEPALPAGVEGRWRWIGTRTLRFEVLPGDIDRLPAATDYRLTVPAGTTSANGAKLDELFSWSFSTPAPTVTAISGLDTSMLLTPVFVATFDQRVDAASVLEHIALDAGDVTSVRVATGDEVAANSSATRALDAALPDRAVAVVPSQALMPGTPVRITVEAGVRSLEGQRLGTVTFTESGSTYGSLRVVESCRGQLEPFSSFGIQLSNPIDLSSFDPAMIRVEPAVPGLRVDVYDAFLNIRGATSGDTDYTVTLSADLTDTFGQRLGDDVSVTCNVGRARPQFIGPDGPFITVDPFAETPMLSYTTVGHEALSVVAWRVEIDELAGFQRYLDSTYSDTRPADPNWPVVLDEVIPIDRDDPNAFVETTIDLSDAFAESPSSQLVIRVEPNPEVEPRSNDYWQNRPRYAWVQQAQLGIDALVDGSELLIWTTDLQTGTPTGDVDVTLVGRSDTVTTDERGLARVDLTSTAITALTARDGDGSSLLPSPWLGAWTIQQQFDQARWYVIDDRGIYRPGETIRMTGLLRTITAQDAQLELPNGATEVDYTVYDPQGNELTTGSTALNALGGFNITVDLPESANAGYAWVELRRGQDYGNHQFQIQDFRTPDFEVVARAESPAPFYVAEPVTIAVDANYFAGGPLPDAEVNWLVTTTDATYRPPNWERFSFGVWTPWWFTGGFDSGFGGGFDECYDCGFGNERFQEFAGRTNGAGEHFLDIEFNDPPIDADGNPGVVDQPTNVVADATVFDVNRQAISSRTTLLVHPARFYVGVSSDRTFVRQGEPLEIDLAVVDVDGAAVEGRTVVVTAGRVDGSYDNGRYIEEIVDPQTCTVTSTDVVSGTAPDPDMGCEFDTPVGGQYRISAIVTDDEGHSNRAELTRWVSGATAVPSRTVDQETVTIVPDRETYAPGDTAELLIQAPFAPASAMVTVTRAGIEMVQVIEASDGSAVVEIPIRDDDIPGVQVRIDMVGTSPRTSDGGTALADAPERPAFAVGTIALSIPPVARTLTVVPSPAADTLQPGESTTVTVSVAGPDGAPVGGAGVALIVVDEAVLSLTQYSLLDPLGVFYTEPYSNLSAELIRSSIVLANPDVFGVDVANGEGVPADTEAPAEEPASEEAAPEVAADADFAYADDGAGRSASQAAPGEGAAEIDVRADFDSLAVFAPDETTAADGTVSVEVELPDNLTRYRIMAVAVDGNDRFGSGESTLTARLPITVRPSAPRFLNWGDRFELPVVVQNQTDADVEVDVAIEASNLALPGDAGKRVVVPANDRIEVRFDAATDAVGTARFRVVAVAVDGSSADAAEVALPVYTPATAEAFATYGVLDDSGAVRQPVLAPDGVIEQFGGLQVSTSSTALQALTDAVLYLHEYRYDSADGFASRIMAIAALRDVLDAFDAEGLPSPAALDNRVETDVERMLALQNDDGGFPYWQRGRESVPWVSVQAVHALVRAVANGYTVDEGGLQRGLDHLRNIEDYTPADYSQDTKDAISAYALYVRNLTGDRDSGKALTLYERAADDLQVDAVARLWPVIDDAAARSAIERRIENAAVETAGAATFATSYGEDAYVIAHSDRTTDGVVLGALISETSGSDLIPKVVAGLLGNQTRGRWNNAYENAFILLAMNDYFNTFEAVDPDFVARVWLGDTFIANTEFRGRSTDTSLTTVPMSELVAAGDTTDLVLASDGSGRLYYRLGLRYAPADFQLDARDEGFVVERTYRGVDDPDDVRRDEDGTWRIKAGATVEVSLTMVADARRTQVALIDPLPAGLEAVNPALATSIPVRPSAAGDADIARSGWWWWQWYEHQNLRDDRAEAFSSYLPAGTYDYTYIARATTPGDFVVPPTRAEEIYAPEVFGRSSSDRVVVD